MKWMDVLKVEFKIWDGPPMEFLVSVGTSKWNKEKIKRKVLRFYGDNYLDIVDMKDYANFKDFFESDVWKKLSGMSNLVVVVDE